MKGETMTAARSGWTITTQRQTQQLTAGNRFEQGVEVGFKTGYGVDGNVFVPLSMFSPEAVRAAVDERAAVLDAVTTLSSEPA